MELKWNLIRTSNDETNFLHKLLSADTLCIGFIDFMLKVKRLLEYINLFSPDEYFKNDNIFKYF